MLGYRTLFKVDDDPSQATMKALGLWRTWLNSKDYEADRIKFGRSVELRPGVTATLLESDQPELPRSTQAVLEEKRPNGTWMTTLTVSGRPDSDAESWVLLDVESPGDRRWTGTPRVARELLQEFEARDGSTRLTPEVAVVNRREVETILRELRDPDRRGLLYLAGSDERFPISRWQGMVQSLLGDTSGLATGYVLDAGATAYLAALLGPTHRTSPGTVRTYLPGVDPGDAADALRHRILSTERILRGDGYRLRRTLGARAKDIAVKTPLPQEVLRVTRQFELRHNTAVFAGTEIGTTGGGTLEGTKTARSSESTTEESRSSSPTSPARTPVTGPGTVAPIYPAATPAESPEEAGTRPAVTSVPAVEDTTQSEIPGSEARSDGGLFGALRRMTLDLLGTEPVADAIERIAALARQGLEHRTAMKQAKQRVDSLTDKLDEANDQLTMAEQLLDDEQLESADAHEQRRAAEEEVRRLQLLLARAGHAEDAYAGSQKPATEPPGSFDDLLSRVGELQFVQFTGNEEVADVLDEPDPLGRWAAKTWDILLALDDYARASDAGQHKGGVHQYLEHPPVGMRGYPVKMHAQSESDGVKNQKKFRNARRFPSPASDDADGKALMYAHFKIAKFGSISPRLHYQDDTGNSGMVYVGYIGRHLPLPGY